MSALRQAKALFLKDVRVELRTREVLSTALLFAIVLGRGVVEHLDFIIEVLFQLGRVFRDG